MDGEEQEMVADQHGQQGGDGGDVEMDGEDGRVLANAKGKAGLQAGESSSSSPSCDHTSILTPVSLPSSHH